MKSPSSNQESLFRQEALDFQKERLYGNVFISPSRSQWFVSIALIIWLFSFFIWISVATYTPMKQLHGWVENKNLLNTHDESNSLLFAYLIVPVEDLSEVQEKASLDINFDGVESHRSKLSGFSVSGISNAIVRGQDVDAYPYLNASEIKKLQTQPSVLLQLHLPNNGSDIKIISGMTFTLSVEKKSQHIINWIFHTASNNKLHLKNIESSFASDWNGDYFDRYHKNEIG